MSYMLEIQDLQLHAGEKLMGNPIDLTVSARQHWAILGQNGCGKTTLLNNIAGLDRSTTGDIRFASKKLSAMSDVERAKSIGYLFQQLPLDFPQTVMEFCSNGLHPHLSKLGSLTKKDIEQIEEILKKLDLTQFTNRKINTLSGGELRRAEIAALILQQPRLWLLDEPTNHLDLAHRHQILHTLVEHINRLAGCSIMVLHDANLASQYCTHALLMFEDGSKLQGPVNATLTAENLSRLYQVSIQQINHHGKKVFIADYPSTH